MVKRLALRVLVGSVALSAILGVHALLVGEFGEFEGRILLTSLTISAVSILAMACGVAWERGRLGRLPRAGVALAAAAGGLTLAGIWEPVNESQLASAGCGCAWLRGASSPYLSVDTGRRRRSPGLSSLGLGPTLAFIHKLWGELDQEIFWKTTARSAIVAVALAHASLVSLRSPTSRGASTGRRWQRTFSRSCSPAPSSPPSGRSRGANSSGAASASSPFCSRPRRSRSRSSTA